MTREIRPSPRSFFVLLRRSLVGAFDDGCLSMAKGAAYSALLSFFPVLTSAAAILVQTRAEFVSNAIEKSLSQIVPPGTQDLVLDQFRTAGERPLALLVAAGLISLWAASGVIKSLIEGFHAAYRVPRNRGFWHQSGVAMALVLVCAIPLLGSSVLLVFGGQVEEAVLKLLSVDPLFNPLAGLWQWVSRIARYVAANGATFALACCLFYFGPYRKQRWRFVWPGALVATGLWLPATIGFGWYVRHVAHYNLMYGSVGAGIALLVWMYLLAAIALVGCEFNAAYERSARV